MLLNESRVPLNESWVPFNESLASAPVVAVELTIVNVARNPFQAVPSRRLDRHKVALVAVLTDTVPSVANNMVGSVQHTVLVRYSVANEAEIDEVETPVVNLETNKAYAVVAVRDYHEVRVPVCVAYSETRQVHMRHSVQLLVFAAHFGASERHYARAECSVRPARRMLERHSVAAHCEGLQQPQEVLGSILWSRNRDRCHLNNVRRLISFRMRVKNVLMGLNR